MWTGKPAIHVIRAYRRHRTHPSMTNEDAATIRQSQRHGCAKASGTKLLTIADVPANITVRVNDDP